MDKLFFKHHIFCCINKRSNDNPKGCCASKHAERFHHYMKERCKELGIESIRVNKAGCLDRCECGPVIVIYPEGVWYRYDTIEDVEEIIQKHLLQGKTVHRLILDKESEK